MNEIQIRLYAEKSFDKYCMKCFHSSDKSGICKGTRSKRQPDIQSIMSAVKTYGMSGKNKSFFEKYFSCFKEEIIR